MGKSSLTKEQTAWLESNIPAFLEAQKKSTVSRFLARTYENWFKKYPERDNLFPASPDKPEHILTLPEEAMLREAIKARRTQLKNWFHWHSRGRKRVFDAPESTLLSRFFSEMSNPEKPKRTRLPKPVEIYSRLYKTKVQEAVNTAKLGNTISRTERLTLFKSAADRLFAEETEQVKGEVAAESERLRNEKESDPKENQDGGDEEKTPEDYQHALIQVPAVLDKFFQWLCDNTGWAFFVGCGGPLPNAGGAIFQHEYYFGPLSEAGNDFQHAYTEFESGFSIPFANFIRGAFPQEIRQMRALDTDVNAAYGRPATCRLDDSDLIVMPAVRSTSPETTSSIIQGPMLRSVPEPNLPSSQPSLSSLMNPPPASSPSTSPSLSLTAPLNDSQRIPVQTSPRKRALGRYRSRQLSDGTPGNDFDIKDGHGGFDGAGDVGGGLSGFDEAGGIGGGHSGFDDEEDSSSLAPGWPSSPISHAFARMNPPIDSPPLSPQHPSPPDDSLIDPLLLMQNFGKPSPTAGILYASAPGFIFQNGTSTGSQSISLPPTSNDLDNPFKSLATSPLVFGRAPVNPFTFGRHSTSPNTPPAPQLVSPSPPMPVQRFGTPLLEDEQPHSITSRISNILEPLPEPHSIASRASNVSEPLPDYHIPGAVIKEGFTTPVNSVQNRPRIQPRPIKKMALSPIAATNTAQGESMASTPLIDVDISTVSSQVTLPSPILAHGDSEAATINKDNAPSKPCNAVTPPVDGPAIPSCTEGAAVYVEKENIPPPPELTRYQKAALTKARRKAEAEAQQNAGELDTGAAEELVVGRVGGKKRKKVEGSMDGGVGGKRHKQAEGSKNGGASDKGRKQLDERRKSRSGREVKPPNLWVPDGRK